MEHFFLTYKQLQKKEVSVNGFDGAEKAMEAFEKSVKAYKDKYAK